ncbi:MAG: SDR family NAD(P)-dependent oxidoreductase [Bacteroidota bacterium]
MNILITGTSSGLGFGLAYYYLNHGHTVFGISRKMNDKLKEYENFRFLYQDISKFSEIETNLVSFLNGIKTLDLVVLNAGMLNGVKDLKDTTLDEIQHVMDVNVWSNKVLIDTLFNHINEIGQVVAISSGAAVSGARGWNAYSLSKATLNMLINLYSKEHLQTHFSALAPGIIKTKMQDYIYELPENEKYPVVERLKQLRDSGEMHDPETAAEINAKAIEQAKGYKSGSFLDSRNM